MERNMTRDQIIVRADAIGPWYHEIELVPGYTTTSCMAPGCRQQWDSIRKLMARVDYKGKVVLDLGTMDGAWAFEAERLGAAKVIATDIFQCDDAGPGYAQTVQDRFNLAKESLGSRVVYAPGGNVEYLWRFMKSMALDSFNIIQCFGILYHVENPLLALRNLYQPLYKNGLLLAETAMWNFDHGPGMRFNYDKAVYNDSTTFWIPNRLCLEQMLKLVGFEIIPDTWLCLDNPRAARVLFVARAI